jgi:hypothetical protein
MSDPSGHPGTARHIHTRFGPRQVVDLLQSIFAAELIAPGPCLWLVSPWITDIPVLDNRANGFTSVVGDWEGSRVRLSTVLAWLLHRGSTVHVATRPDEVSEDFLERLETLAGSGRARLRVHQTEALHEKGVLGEGFYLSGSMNFTQSGLGFNQEMLYYDTNPGVVAHHRQLFTAWWGGAVT